MRSPAKLGRTPGVLHKNEQSGGKGAAGPMTTDLDASPAQVCFPPIPPPRLCSSHGELGFRPIPHQPDRAPVQQFCASVKPAYLPGLASMSSSSRS
jgi:hypothetical protein